MTDSGASWSPLRLYSTAARSVVEVDLPTDRDVRMYTCGPTVYRPVHLGNLRSYLMADWLRRLLLRRELRVRHVKNLTDVGHMRQELLDRGEDKVIAEALSAGVSAAQIATRFTEEFFRDEGLANILPADEFPRATAHVTRMTEITAALVASGHAYERNGNVYFRVSRFAGYGELGGSLSREGLRQGVRAEADPLKEDARDFALWKGAEAGRTELVWDSPWGRGFPGWHIECTAMATQHLGSQLDIHTGGVDNIFPHHEDERAQSEAFTSQAPFALIWVHGQHLLADGVKMAKSTGNAYTLSELQALEFEPLAFRYLCLTAHYRSRLNFTLSSLRAAQTGLHRLRRHVAAWGAPAEALEPDARALATQFWALASDNLALPRCLALLWSLARGTGVGAQLPVAQKAALARDFDMLLGLDLGQPVPRRAADPFRSAVSSVRGIPDDAAGPPSRALSVNLLVQPDEDLDAVERCVRSVLAERHGLDLEVVLVDATGSLAAHERLSTLVADAAAPPAESRSANETEPRVRLVWIDHDPGAAAGRNLGLRASRGALVALLDASVEVIGDAWRPLVEALADSEVGAVGSFGLVTSDLRHFQELDLDDHGHHSDGVRAHEVDALQNYVLVFRRADLARIGPLDEHYRFYRILDLDLSYTIRQQVGRIVSLDPLPLVRHRHALWEALSDGDREERSRKNFGRFVKRWDHHHELSRHGDPAHHDGPVAVHG